MRSDRSHQPDSLREPRRLGLWPATGPIAALAVAATIGCGDRQSSQATSATPPATVWHDPSPHTTTFVIVPGGVRLEVLDWGGHGPPLVFIAGLENTGHVFDDFAPRFTNAYHVVALTRRGWGMSDHPDTGYSMATLAADVHAALDSLHLDHVDLVGHSIAGQELTWVAVDHPSDVAKLVYLDAGFDYHAHKIPTPLPELPKPTAQDSASAAAGLAYNRRISGSAIPEGDYRATEKFDSTGRDLGPASPASFSAAVVTSAEAVGPPLSRVKVPTLAIYDWPTAPNDFLPWIAANDTSGAHWL